ncbi:MAG TPA: hypothetical protein VL490_05260 [Mucilaginibacter sp.]|nr:hypothetical protein [Mucilaginibacter sp.]
MYPKSPLIISAAGALLICSSWLYKAEKTVQIDISPVLNTRSVTTLSKGKFVPYTNGVDKQNGYFTASAAVLNGDDAQHALPDNPLIAANEHHPAILLHYNNDDAVKHQTRYITDTSSFTIKVPSHHYSGLYLSLTSAYGASKLQFDLIYKDGTEVKNFILPDWFNDVADNDANLSYVVHNMGKWSNTNKMVEKDHHNIHALNIHPDAGRVLTAVRLKNLSATYLVFWAATGIAK